MYKWRGGSLGILSNKLSKRMPENEKPMRKVRDIDELISSIKKQPHQYKPISSSERNKRNVKIISETFENTNENAALFLDIDPNFSRICNISKSSTSQNELKTETNERKCAATPTKEVHNSCDKPIPTEEQLTYHRAVIFERVQNYRNIETQTE